MTTSTLYDLGAAYTAALTALEQAETPEEVDAGLAALDEAGGDFADKAERCIGLSREFSARADARRSEAHRLFDLSRADDAKVNAIRAYVLHEMKAAGIARLDTLRFVLSVRQSPPAVQVLDVNTLPAEFLIETVAADKEAIKRHWKATGEIPVGCEITRGESLVIR